MKRNAFYALLLVAAMILGMSLPVSAIRHSGDDRYATAVTISREGWAEGSEVVVLARGDLYADALVGVPLAFAYQAPVLLTRSFQLPEITLAEIVRLGAGKAMLLGGTKAISEKVEAQLQDLGLEVKRIGGANRFETAAAIARLVAPEGTSTAFIAYAWDFPDALAAAAYAAANGHPILLTNTDSLDEATMAALEALGVEKVFAVGGRGVISDAVLEQLPNPRRFSGDDRYMTALELARIFAGDASTLFFASGTNVSGGADAIAGAALAARQGTGVLLLGDSLPQQMRNYLSSLHLMNLVVLGGPAAISQGLYEQLQGYLYAPPIDPVKPPTPVPSDYEIDVHPPLMVVPGKAAIVEVVFRTKTQRDIGYDGVRFKFFTDKPGVIFEATDSLGIPHTFNDQGYWGPAEGFAIPAKYSDSMAWSVTFADSGDFNITIQLIDAASERVIMEEVTLIHVCEMVEISGTVTDSEGSPLKDERVFAVRTDNFMIVGDTLTDAAGQYTMDVMADAQYRVTFMRAPNWIEAELITIAKVDATLDHQFAEVYWVSGTVTYGGAPLANAGVTVWVSDTSGLRGTTDATGHYFFWIDPVPSPDIVFECEGFKTKVFYDVPISSPGLVMDCELEPE